jgi:predicted nucleic acid-binding protein
MRTAIDTNVLSALWSQEPFANSIASNLGNAKQDGALIISAPVYAELLAHPTYTEAAINTFLDDTGISTDYELSSQGWLEAGRRFAKYAARRRRDSKAQPKRLLADFIIGAHALVEADRFMTLDPHRYRLNFPELKLI